MTRLMLILLLFGTAHAQEASKMLIPGHVGEYPSTYTNANEMYCFTVPAEFSITSATMMASTISSSSGTNFGFALYSADGTTEIAEISTTAVGNVVKQSGLAAYNVVGGDLYLLCTCAETAGDAYFGVQQAIGCCQDVNVTQIIQAFHPAYAGTSTPGCSGAANPPDAPITITAEVASPGRTAHKIPVVLLQK